MVELVAEAGILGAVLWVIARLTISGMVIALYVGIGIALAYLAAYLVWRYEGQDETEAVKDFREEEWEGFLQVFIVLGWALILPLLLISLPLIALLWSCGQLADRTEKAVQ